MRVASRVQRGAGERLPWPWVALQGCPGPILPELNEPTLQHSMENRFWLRIDSGERSGERVAAPPGVLSIGKQPQNDLQLTEASVSGRHAELRVDAEGASVVDKDSTNGTFVGTERVQQHALAHGDRLRFGRVSLTFLDGLLDDGAGSGETGGEVEVGRVSDIHVARSGRRSVRAGVLLLVALLAAGGFALKRLSSEESAGGPAPAPVLSVEGNLLADSYSFESEQAEAAWESAEEAPTYFSGGSSWRISGESGLGTTLEPGEWALSSSPIVRLSRGDSLELTAAVEASAGTELRVGLRFLPQDERVPPLSCFSNPLVEDAQHLRLFVSRPPGYDRVQAQLFAAAGQVAGEAGFDDVVLLMGGGRGDAVSSGDHSLLLHGEPPMVAHLFHLDQLCLAELQARLPGQAAGPVSALAGLGGRAGEGGLVLSVRDAPAGARLTFLVPSELALEGVATTGEEGYRAHAAEFEAPGTQSLFLGSDLSLIRMGFSTPVSVSGRPVARGRQLEVALDGLGEVELRMAFRDERSTARGMADRARDEVTAGRPGSAVVLWTELLDRYPYVSELVREAQLYRTKAISEGLAGVRALREEVAGARFFELAGLLEACRSDTQALAALHAGTEVEESAGLLLAEINAELQALAEGSGNARRTRLEGVLEVLNQRGAGGLVARVRAELAATAADEGGDGL